MREKVAKALFDFEVASVGRLVKWDDYFPAEPDRSEWLKRADAAIEAMKPDK